MSLKVLAETIENTPHSALSVVKKTLRIKHNGLNGGHLDIAPCKEAPN